MKLINYFTKQQIQGILLIGLTYSGMIAIDSYILKLNIQVGFTIGFVVGVLVILLDHRWK